jgi:hypothetical protein
LPTILTTFTATNQMINQSRTAQNRAQIRKSDHRKTRVIIQSPVIVVLPDLRVQQVLHLDTPCRRPKTGTRSTHATAKWGKKKPTTRKLKTRTIKLSGCRYGPVLALTPAIGREGGGVRRRARRRRRLGSRGIRTGGRGGSPSHPAPYSPGPGPSRLRRGAGRVRGFQAAQGKRRRLRVCDGMDACALLRGFTFFFSGVFLPFV